GTADRREALPGPEQAGLHEDPFGLPGLVVEVHLGDLADPVAFGVDSGAADVLLVVLRRGHGCLPSYWMPRRPMSGPRDEVQDMQGYPARTATNSAVVRPSARTKNDRPGLAMAVYR